jgi:hypothetical protein
MIGAFLTARLGEKVGKLAMNVIPLALAVGALSLLIYAAIHQHTKLVAMETEYKQLQHDKAQADLNLTTVTVERDVTRSAHKACMDEIRTSVSSQETAVARLAQDMSDIQRSQKNARVERVEIYKQPGCRELAEIDISASCPALAGSLRRRALEVSAAR